MPATLTQLLARGELGLRLLTPAGVGDPDASLAWAHSSDLPDPTPFLSRGQVLLVTEPPEDAEPYVGRLAEHGIAALGFGTEVVRDGAPAALVEACTRHGLPLFEVPYRTPFIAIARFVADRVAADAYARSTWALRASRAISLAALRPDALGAVLSELSRQIERPVALVGGDGAVARSYPSGVLDARARKALADAADPLLRSGRRAAGTVGTDAGPFALQTLGAAGRLRGVLAVGSDGLDAAAQQVVTGVVALAGLALEQSRAADAARERLRTAVWRALLAGDLGVAASVAEPVLGALPAAPLRVAVLSGPAIAAALDWLESNASGFFAREGADLLVLGDDDAASAIAVRFDLRGGLSAPAELDALPAALEQAIAARGRATADDPIPSFEDVAGAGMLALLHTPDARAVAQSALRPLTAADPSLPGVLRTWLDSDGVYDVAARKLGIHRHTLRARVAEAERLLGRDLTSFAARADLYAALRASA
ncbi:MULTISPECIES: PucR family transcriptional regulator [unclassified Leifsonia]|uniref:PucR family transcriptional regulator n=1 Tax=unclassified Leifsonia TaxID=2663824 RepID=UPI000375767E|nr:MULTISPECIES: PucR family transcriptional regulator [unclassified Leifsonia]TDQ02473.1 purine catabolism regulator [Leifsonia sp. 115AMFTsu3.1]